MYSQTDLGSSLACESTLNFYILILRKYTLKFQRHINDFISIVINAYLIWKYPIKSLDGKQDLPTCPYRWPNGQGDSGKFLQGERNSEAWRKKYGGVYRVWSGLVSEIVLTQPEHVQAVFADSDKHIKAKNNNSGWLMGELLGKCVGLLSQDEWKEVRTTAEVPFLQNNVKRYIPYMEQRTVKYLENLHTHGKLEGGLLNPVEDLKLLPFWILAHIIYGELSTELEEELKRIIPLRESVFRRMIMGGLTRFWLCRFLPLSVVKRLTEFQTTWSKFNDLAYHRATVSGINAPIIQLYDALHSDRLTRKQMVQTLDEVLFANLDVTMGGISWILVFLAANPKPQKDLRDEIMKHMPTTGENERWRSYITSASTLLNASIMESSRLRPLAAFSVPQAVPTDRVVGGFVIPAGTNCMVDSYALNTHNSFWGDDSTSYRPSRFFERSNTSLRYNLWRFGFGPRTCMGKNVADLMIRILVAHVVQNYELALTPGSSIWDKNGNSWITHPDTLLRCERT